MADYETRRRWAREEAEARLKLRPLRDKVNKTLKETGIPHAEHHASGRISGLTHSTAGWETESDIFDDPPCVTVSIRLIRSTYLPGEQTPPERLAWRSTIVQALRAAGLKVIEEANLIRVLPSGV